MIKYAVTFAFFAFLLLASGCQKQPSAPEEGIHLNLELKLTKQPSGPTLFDPTAKDVGNGLRKAGRLVEAQVLMLHFDSDSGTVAVDASEYANNASLVNVQRVSSPNKSALSFNGDGSHAIINHSPELNGTKGLAVQAMVYPSGSIRTQEQILLAKHDVLDGWVVGIVSDRLFCRIRNRGIAQELIGKTILEPNSWHSFNVVVGNAMTLIVDGKQDTSISTVEPPPNSVAQLVLGAGSPSIGIFASYFSGYLDEISIQTVTEYEDFDFLRVMVMDLSAYKSPEQIYGTELWYQYESAWRDFTIDTTKTPSWEDWKRIWTSFFTVVSDQVLSIQGGFAVGTIQGVEGLNFLLVAGMRENKVIYYGFGAAVAKRDEPNTAEVQIWPAVWD